MIRAVIDTNVFVSGATGTSYPAQAIEAWKNQQFILITSPSIITEIHQVLHRPKIKAFTGLTNQDINQIITALATKSFVTPEKITVDLIKNDPADNKFITSALEGFADYIVTGDGHLLSIKQHQGISIIKPKQFVQKV